MRNHKGLVKHPKLAGGIISLSVVMVDGGWLRVVLWRRLVSSDSQRTESRLARFWLGYS